MIAIQDNKTQFVVVTDVSQGGSSLSKGEVELMVHRRVQADDSRGVQEPLNETMCGCNDIRANPGSMVSSVCITPDVRLASQHRTRIILTASPHSMHTEQCAA